MSVAVGIFVAAFEAGETAMADRGPLSNRDMPRPNNGYGNSGYGNPGYGNNGYENPGYGNAGYGNTGYGNTAHGNNGYGSHGYNNSGRGNGGYDNFDRRGSVDVRKPQQQNAYRMRNNRNNNWQRGPVAPSNSWRDQGRIAEMGSRNSYHNSGLKALTLSEAIANNPSIVFLSDSQIHCKNCGWFGCMYGRCFCSWPFSILRILKPYRRNWPNSNDSRNNSDAVLNFWV